MGSTRNNDSKTHTRTRLVAQALLHHTRIVNRAGDQATRLARISGARPINSYQERIQHQRSNLIKL